jgi:pimeloyl-ACP methyl ester carboxylesterase
MFTFLDGVHDGRLILIDQRGHGLSDRASSYRTDDYCADLERILGLENISEPILLGHSLGGTNAIRYATTRGDVRALIIEDIGSIVNCSNESFRSLPSIFGSVFDAHESFAQAGIGFDSYFMESLRYDGNNWKFNFDYADMIESQIEMNGDHWHDWDRLDCPILLMHGTKSWACSTENIMEMGRRNGKAKVILYEGVGHTVRDEARERYCAEVQEFLASIQNL